MEITRPDQTQIFEHGPNCRVRNYPLPEAPFSFAEISLNGRHPPEEEHRVVNRRSNEMLWVKKGGPVRVVAEKKEAELEEGDVCLIPPNEEYYLETKRPTTLGAICWPPWRPEQHEEIE